MHTRLFILGTALLLSTPAKPDRAPLVVHGRVSDGSTNKPVAGAVISVADSKPSSITDEKGQYRLIIDKAPADTLRLVVRRIGYTATSSSIGRHAPHRCGSGG